MCFFYPANLATVTPAAAFLISAFFEGGHVGMVLQHGPHFQAELAGALPVDDADERQAAHIGFFQVGIQPVERILRPLAAQVQLHAGGGGEN